MEAGHPWKAAGERPIGHLSCMQIKLEAITMDKNTISMAMFPKSKLIEQAFNFNVYEH